MLKTEWKKIFSNKLVILFLAVVALVPTLYSAMFLKSMWDPYGKLDKIPVAIVNQDKPAEYNGRTIRAGEQLVDSLLEDGSMKFEEVSSQSVAEEEMKDGNYYMIITIPENFSENSLTILDKEPEKMTLTYKTNPGANYISSKMSESAMKEVSLKVREEVTKEYGEEILALFGEVGDGFQEASDGSGKINKGVKKLEKGNDTITTNLDTLAESSLTFKDGAKQLHVGLNAYVNGAAEVDKGAKKLSKGAKKLNAGAGELSEGVNALATGSKSLTKGVKSYTKGVKSAYAGSKSLKSNSAALNKGVSSVSDGVSSLQSGSSAILGGLNKMSTTLSESLSEEKQKEITTVTNGLDALNTGISQLNTAVQGMDVAIDTQGITGDLTGVGQDIQGAGAKVKEAGTSMTKASQNVATAGESVTKMAGYLQEALKDENLSAETKQQILLALNEVTKEGGVKENLAAYQTNATAAGDCLTQTGASLTDAGAKATSLGKNLSGLGSVGDSVTTLKKSVQTISDNSAKLLPGAKTAITSLNGGLKEVKQALDKTGEKTEDMGLIQGMTAVNNGVTQLKTGIDGKNGLSAGVTAYTAGVSELNAGLQKINSNSKALVSGSTKLRDGTLTLNASVPELKDGVKQLKDGSVSLAAGTDQLVSNSPALLSGVEQLSSGAVQISDGAYRLSDGSATLGNGLVTLSDGTKELKDSLQEGADKVNSYEMTDKTSDMLSAPVETKETFFSKIDNNGNAMAPYMMCVGLWVAGIAFCLVFPEDDKRQQVKSGAAWWLGRSSIVWLIAILQAIVMIVLLMTIDGLNPDRLPQLMIASVVTSLAFAATVFFFINSFGKVGDFIALVCLIIQLSCCAGTYPIETSGGIFEALNPYMPFTYAVHAFRATISESSMDITKDMVVLGGIFVVFTVLTFLYYEWKTYLIRHHKRSKLSGVRAFCMGVMR